MNKFVSVLSTATLFGLLASGCASLQENAQSLNQHADQRQARDPAQAAVMSSVIVQGEVKTSICEGSSTSCLATWSDAVAFCKSQGGHLPTAREYAAALKPAGTKTIDTIQANVAPPAPYYLVDCVNEDGSKDSFYMNHSEYHKPAGQIENHLFWTASSPPGHLDYAHVYYDEWGGGGGNPVDHLKSHFNSFQCIRGH